MKLFTLALLLFSAHAQAAPATLTLDAGASHDLVENLVLAGLKPDMSKPVYRFEINDLECHAFYGGPGGGSGKSTDILYGLTEYTCRHPGLTFGKAKLLFDALNAIDKANEGKISIGVCLMGTCRAELKKLLCRIDSREYDGSKRYACEVTDSGKYE